MTLLVLTAVSGSCAEAQDAVDDANRALAKAELKGELADDAFKDDTSGRADADIAANFIACLLTSGALGILGANPAMPVIGGAACIAYAGYQEWRLNQKIDEDRKAQEAASAEESAARWALYKAREQREKACHYYSGGCGSRGGRGYRRPDGKCAGWHDWGYA